MGSRIVYAFASAFFVLVIFVGGTVDVVGYFRTARPFPKDQITARGIWHGGSQEAVEAWLREESTVLKTLRPAYNELLFKIARTAPPTVVIGRDMIFDAVRVQPFEPAFWNKKSSELVDAANEIQKALSPWGGKLLALMVPDTIRVYPDQIKGLEWAASPKFPYYGDFLRGLDERGIASIDLVKVLTEADRRLGERVYRSDDHHWNQLGCRAAVDATWDWMQKSGFEGGANLKLHADLRPGRPLGSLMYQTGWEPGSTLYRQFKSTSFEFVVKNESGSQYAETFNTDVAVASDSFGLLGFAPMLALVADHRVAESCLAAKGPLYSVFDVLRAINEGWRPRLLVWVFEERATYAGEGPMAGWQFSTSVPDARKGIREHRIPIESVSAGKGATGSVHDGMLEIVNDSKLFEIRVPRPPAPATHLVCYMRPAYLEIWGTSIGLLDSAGSIDERELNKGRTMVLDRMRQGWQRVVLPLPPGSADLSLVIDRGEIGGKFTFQGFGGLTVGESVPDTAAAMPTPVQGELQTLVAPDWFVPNPRALLDRAQFPDPAAYGAVLASAVDARFPFELTLDKPIGVPVTFVVDGGSCPTPEPVVFSLRRLSKDGPAMVEYQVEVTAEPGRRTELPAVLSFSPESPGKTRSEYALEVRMTPAAAKRAVAAVRVGK